MCVREVTFIFQVFFCFQLPFFFKGDISTRGLGSSYKLFFVFHAHILCEKPVPWDRQNVFRPMFPLKLRDFDYFLQKQKKKKNNKKSGDTLSFFFVRSHSSFIGFVFFFFLYLFPFFLLLCEDVCCECQHRRHPVFPTPHPLSF